MKASDVSESEWQTRVDLAAFYRLCAHFGWTDLIYTHISARVPGEEEHFLLNPFGWLFDEVTASGLVKIDLEGNVVAPTDNKVHRAGFVIHSAIHSTRPDAQCVMHSHTRAGMAISMLKEGLLPLSQHAMMFTGRVGYHESEGFAVNLEERQRLIRDMGSNAVLILRNHGTLVAGSTIAETFSMMWHLEKAMQAQMDALATQRELTLPLETVAQELGSIAFTGHLPPKPGAEPGPLGRLEWPAMLRFLDRQDPSFRT